MAGRLFISLFLSAQRILMTNHRTTIYIVDDDASICRALSLLLESHGFKVETFNRAEEFLTFKHYKMTCCLILDVRLPGFNGLTLQKKMLEGGIAIPIVFITGYGDIPMSVNAISHGAVDFLPKPFTDKNILNAIERAISKNKAQNKKSVEIEKIKKRVKTLSPSEFEVFRFVVKGMLNKQIAAKRGTVLQTVKVQRASVMRKMRAKTVTELIHLAQKAGVTPAKH